MVSSSSPAPYRFVAPRGVGVKLHDMLKNPEKLRKALIENWSEYCEQKISASDAFPLMGNLAAYVAAFDFTRVWYLTPQEVLNQHRKTKHWTRRFPGEPPIRPDPTPPPVDVQQRELVYLTKLLGAYADHTKQSVSCVEDLQDVCRSWRSTFSVRGVTSTPRKPSHDSRVDQFKPGAFEGVKQHIFDGVVDTTMAAYADGFQCVLAVTDAGAKLPLPQSDLNPYVSPADKKGFCHHLANDDKLDWWQS